MLVDFIFDQNANSCTASSRCSYLSLQSADVTDSGRFEDGDDIATANCATESSTSLRGLLRRRWFLVIIFVVPVFAWKPFCDIQVSRALHEADTELLTLKRYELVEADARRLLWYAPDHPQGLLILGIALSQRQEFSEAVSFLERIPGDSLFHPEAVLTLCECLLGDGQYWRADLLLQKSLQTYPDHSQLRLIAHDLYINTYRYGEAIEVLEQGLHYTLADEKTLRRLLKFQTQVYPPEAVTRKLLRDCPRWRNEPDVLAALGYASIKEGEVEKAQSYFTQALHLDPTNPRIKLWCSDLYLSTDQADKARTLLQSFDEDVMRSPGNWIHSEYWRLKSVLFERQGDVELSLKYCNESLRLIQQPECLSLKAGILRKLSFPDEAEATSRQLIQRGKLDLELLKLRSEQTKIPLNAELCEQLGNVFSGLGRHSQAKAWHIMAEYASGNLR